MTVWFGSDYHFDHKNVINFCNRPFSNVTEMNNYIIERFKDQVKSGDVVYFLGDFQFSNTKVWLESITDIQGVEVHLIQGNHDNKKVCNFKGWKSSTSLKDIKVNDTKIVLCHYPIEEWRAKDHGSIHLHGHTHGMMSHENQYVYKRLDIGYDNIKDVLISFEDVITRITQDHFDYNRRINDKPI